MFFVKVEVNCASVWVNCMKDYPHAGGWKTSQWFPVASHKLFDEQLLCFWPQHTERFPAWNIPWRATVKALSTQRRPRYKSRYNAGFDNTVREKMRRLPGGLGIEVFFFFFFFPPSSLFKFTLGSIWWQVVQSSWIGSGPDSPPRLSHMANLSEQTQWKQQRHSPRL